MLAHLEILKPKRPKPKIPDIRSKKRILCILEGEFELKYIIKVFKLNGYSEDCLKLTEDLIKVAWCDRLPKSINIVYKDEKTATCKFNGGGSCKGRMPTPAIKAFQMYNQDLSTFDSVFVFFDSDKDKDNEVEKYFIDEFNSSTIANCLLVSNPCFESSLIDFCSCGKCRIDINNMEDERQPCIKYKRHFSKLACFDGSKHLVANLTNKNISDLKQKNSKLNCVNKIIEDFMERCENV